MPSTQERAEVNRKREAERKRELRKNPEYRKYESELRKLRRSKINATNKKWRLANPGKHWERVRKYRLTHPEQHKRVQAERRKRDWVKNQARWKLRYAVQKGAIARPEYCQECGIKTKLEGHHYNGYDHPFDVLWLCVKCHRDKHPVTK